MKTQEVLLWPEIPKGLPDVWIDQKDGFHRVQNVYNPAIHVYLPRQQTIGIVLHRAKEWGVHPKRVGIVGFSTGGGLSAMAETRFTAIRDPTSRCLAMRVSSPKRP